MVLAKITIFELGEGLISGQVESYVIDGTHSTYVSSTYGHIKVRFDKDDKKPMITVVDLVHNFSIRAFIHPTHIICDSMDKCNICDNRFVCNTNLMPFSSEEKLKEYLNKGNESES